MRCIAVPVFDTGGTVPGSIAISRPASRFDIPKLDELRGILQSYADGLSRELGWNPTGNQN
ncbi:IclR family transcriptional regulator C-terminal domain-containing protein [Pseudorhodobacter sp. W20_MBD10_FR17]|uniref:IclR family transcriptional regulator domain-containing protein n=1 Tax=Pseudorhodobacter sp. W20_MBD10_FR17 TaxID=3240266 RepID=UPI003F9DCCF0